MSLTALLDIELTVPDPEALSRFWVDLGLVATSDATLGTADRPSQLRLRDGGYRHVSEVRLACSDESDLVTIKENLAALGVSSVLSDGVLRCEDPLADHVIGIEVGDQAPVTPSPARPFNRPGVLERVDGRSPAAAGELRSTPRRMGHVVFGTTDVAASTRFYRDGIGFTVSDVLGDGFGAFLRCTTDHHNLFLMPAPVPCMNHYAFEMDDVDAIGLAGTKVVSEWPEASIYGVGRHVIGANRFWYLLDPAGGMFEL